jgi:hypothetical protein
VLYPVVDVLVSFLAISVKFHSFILCLFDVVDLLYNCGGTTCLQFSDVENPVYIMVINLFPCFIHDLHITSYKIIYAKEDFGLESIKLLLSLVPICVLLEEVSEDVMSMGAQIAGAKSPRQLHFAWWCLIFVGP